MSLFDEPDDVDVTGWAGLYALDALEGNDLVRFEAALVGNADLQAEVAEFRATAAELSVASAEEPPAQLRVNVLEAVGSTRQDSPVVDLAARRGGRLGGVRASWMAAAAALIVVAGVFGYVVRGDGGTTNSSDVAALLAQPDARLVPLTGADGRSAQVVVSPSKNRLVVVSDQLDVDVVDPFPTTRRMPCGPLGIRVRCWLVCSVRGRTAGSSPGSMSTCREHNNSA